MQGQFAQEGDAVRGAGGEEARRGAEDGRAGVAVRAEEVRHVLQEAEDLWGGVGEDGVGIGGRGERGGGGRNGEERGGGGEEWGGKRGGGRRTYGDVDLAEHGDAFEGVFEGEVLGRGDDDGACVVGEWMVTLAFAGFPGWDGLGWLGFGLLSVGLKGRGRGGGESMPPIRRRNEAVNDYGMKVQGKERKSYRPQRPAA